MVVDLKFRGRVGTNGLMFVPYYARSPRAFIANYSSWREYSTQGKIAEVATSLLSHETLHLTINKFSMSASESLDNLFGRSDRWEMYHHGLGDFDKLREGTASKKSKNARKVRRVVTKKKNS